MNLDMISDFLLLAASGVACFYCWMLSRRLKALSSAEKGIGAGISQLSQSAEEVKAAVAASRAGSDAAAARLEALLERAEQKCAELSALYAQIEGAGEAVAAKTEGATRRYVDTLSPFLSEANEIADKLFAAIERTPRAAAAPADDQDAAYLEPVDPRAARAAGGHA